MSIILFLVFGLVVGLIARALVPGKQSMGWIATTALGVVGSFLGGFLMSLITRHNVLEFHTAGIIGSIVGAILVVAAAGYGSSRGVRA
jgi:uncharacterized membrane protein YeaQ/YmgE (transglycosylase-associated protein family)